MQGEIDILEGVNDEIPNYVALHTGSSGPNFASEFNKVTDQFVLF